MLIFEKDGIQYIYIHIPKTSGRYIRKQICNNFKCFHLENQELCASSYENLAHHFYHFTYQRIIDYESNFNELSPIHKYITFVRNPYHKLISGYFFSKKRTLIDFDIHKLSILTMEEYIESLANDFKQFIKIDLKNAVVDNTLFCYKIVTLQSNYILDENNNIPENMIVHKLEDYASNSELQSFFNFLGFDLKTYDLSKFYDAETLAIVNEVYKKDFDLFGYEMISNI